MSSFTALCLRLLLLAVETDWSYGPGGKTIYSNRSHAMGALCQPAYGCFIIKWISADISGTGEAKGRRFPALRFDRIQLMRQRSVKQYAQPELQVQPSSLTTLCFAADCKMYMRDIKLVCIRTEKIRLPSSVVYWNHSYIDETETSSEINCYQNSKVKSTILLAKQKSK